MQGAMMFSFRVQVPRVGGDNFTLDMLIGQTIFVLGSNGSGKSGLLHYLYRHTVNHAKWIRAHRPSCLSSNFPATTAAELHMASQSYSAQQQEKDARYRTHHDSFYGNEALMGLISRQNSDARATHEAVRRGDRDEINLRRYSKDTLDELNSILLQSNIRLAIKIGDKDDLTATKVDVRSHGTGDASYGVDEMSDGERSAFLLISNVLTAPPKTLFLIDEPETHLHHSIASPLLSRLFAFRSDCSFVVAVHQVSLPMDNPEAPVLLLRDCVFDNPADPKWDLDFIENAQSIPEDIRATILGARRVVVFVEGEQSSLDYPFYASVFPGASVIPIGGCHSVKSAVTSMRAASSLHHIKCFGVIDRDHREQKEIEALRASDIFVVDGYSVESIYYDERMQKNVVKRSARDDADRLLAKAKQGAMEALSKSKKTMCDLSARARVRQFALDRVCDMDWEHDDCIEVPVRPRLEEEKNMFQTALDKNDLDFLVRRYPTKKSGALSRIAKALGFGNCEAYERAVITLLQDDKAALQHVRERFSELVTAMENSLNQVRHFQEENVHPSPHSTSRSE